MRGFRRGMADSAEGRISDAIIEAGFEPVSIWVVGQDPASRAVRAVAVFDDPSSGWGEGYTVSDFWDYTRNPDRALRSQGLIDAPYLAGVTRGEAVQCATDRVGSLLSSYSWLIPGTDRLVPGCWMEYDERWTTINPDTTTSTPSGSPQGTTARNMSPQA